VVEELSQELGFATILLHLEEVSLALALDQKVPLATLSCAQVVKIFNFFKEIFLPLEIHEKMVFCKLK